MSIGALVAEGACSPTGIMQTHFRFETSLTDFHIIIIILEWRLSSFRSGRLSLWKWALPIQVVGFLDRRLTEWCTGSKRSERNGAVVTQTIYSHQFCICSNNWRAGRFLSWWNHRRRNEPWQRWYSRNLHIRLDRFETIGRERTRRAHWSCELNWTWRWTPWVLIWANWRVTWTLAMRGNRCVKITNAAMPQIGSPHWRNPVLFIVNLFVSEIGTFLAVWTRLRGRWREETHGQPSRSQKWKEVGGGGRIFRKGLLLPFWPARMAGSHFQTCQHAKYLPWYLQIHEKIEAKNSSHIHWSAISIEKLIEDLESFLPRASRALLSIFLTHRSWIKRDQNPWPLCRNESSWNGSST